MGDLVGRALELWGRPLPQGGAALEAFRGVYDDPVTVNGVPTALQVLVDRSRMLQAALADLRHTVLASVEAPGRRAFAFRLSGRFVGPLETPLGLLAPTGRPVEVAGQDLFVVDEQRDRVTALWAQADLLSLLLDAGAVARLDR
ncbi:ester cyclase [Microlunatus flavus]|uniref:SnoaL-like polyketide cyclase n=1 Tax=Microlunatus flavus TaxID=1036181 RepID=A0A1H9AU71_9ACTN|nr:ester cyclase [Microlunatus flavus]SEP80085.1 SnoaL-like polyketide cyclase [Microlunatus flavus]